MANVKNKEKTNGWIILDRKLQSNSGELVEMAKTIQGVTIKQRGDKIWVKFPTKKQRTAKTGISIISSVSRVKIGRIRRAY